MQPPSRAGSSSHRMPRYGQPGSSPYFPRLLRNKARQDNRAHPSRNCVVSRVVKRIKPRDGRTRLASTFRFPRPNRGQNVQPGRERPRTNLAGGLRPRFAHPKSRNVRYEYYACKPKWLLVVQDNQAAGMKAAASEPLTSKVVKPHAFANSNSV